MHKIIMEVIPHSEQRYDTLGDYWTDPDGTWQFRVSDLGDWRYNFSVLLHEFVEFGIMQHKGISEEEVLKFDLAVEDDSEFASDPGFDPKAPYHQEHVFADCVERLIAPKLGMLISDPWDASERLPKWLPKQ